MSVFSSHWWLTVKPLGALLSQGTVSGMWNFEKLEFALVWGIQNNWLLYVNFVAWEIPIGGEVFFGFISFKSDAFTSFVHGVGICWNTFCDLLYFSSMSRRKTAFCGHEVMQHACRIGVKLDTRFLYRTMLGFCARILINASSIHLLSSKRKSHPFL